MAKNIRTKPTTSTIHEGTPIVVILYYCNLVPTVFSYPSLVGRTATEEGLFNNVVDSHLQVGAPRIQSRSKEGWWGRPRASVWLKNKEGVGGRASPPPPPPPPPLDPPMTLQVHGLRSTNSLHVSVETIVSSLKRTGFKAWWPPQD